MGEISITDVEFLTPARVSVEEDGTAFVRQVSIDLANRKIYDSSGGLFIWADKIFQFLDSANPLPEDFFSASEEVSEKAQEAYEHAREVHDSHVENNNE